MSKNKMSLFKLLIIYLKNMNIYLFSHITLFSARCENGIVSKRDGLSDFVSPLPKKQYRFKLGTI